MLSFGHHQAPSIPAELGARLAGEGRSGVERARGGWRKNPWGGGRDRVVRGWFASSVLAAVLGWPAAAAAVVSLEATSPADGVTRFAPVVFRVQASSDTGVQRLTLFGDWPGGMQPVAEQTWAAEPQLDHRFSLEVPAGSWQWRAELADADGVVSSATFALAVVAGCDDGDGDGYGVYPGTSRLVGCAHDGIDCDDTDAAVHPFAVEVCGNGVDEDCRHGADQGCGPPAAFDGWRVMPVRSQGEFERGEPGGRAEQWLQGADRCRADADIVYLSHDCGQNWRSFDGGRSWEKPLNLGLGLIAGQSIAVDPVDCSRVLQLLDDSSDWRHPERAGLYRSSDGGDHWQQVLVGPTNNSRRYEHNLAYAPSTVDGQGALRWVAALYDVPGEVDHADSALFVSDDRGLSWRKGAGLAALVPIYEVHIAPDDAERVLVASEQGLYASADGGASLQPLGDLPAGPVTSAAFDPQDAERVWAVARADGGVGLYRSGDGGQHFARLTAADAEQQAVLDDARRLFLHPRDGDVLYLLPQSGGGGRTALRSDDGGQHFALVSIALPADVRQWRWGLHFSGDFAFMLPAADDADDVVAQSGGAALYRSGDGLSFHNGSTLYTGANCGLTNHSIAFDRRDPDRFALGNADIGMYLTDTGADWFVDRGVPHAWVHDLVPWSSQYTLDFRPGQPDEVIAVAGYVFDKKLVRSEDAGRNWSLVDDDSGRNWRVVYHPFDADVVYAGQRRSLDGGRTFAALPVPAALYDAGLQIMDLCRAQPDVLYAASRDSGRILRSNDRGASWELYAAVDWSLAPYDSITTFAVDPFDCNAIYALDRHGDLARFDGQAWQSLGVLAAAGVEEGYYTFVRAVQVDPRQPEVIYAGLFGAGIPSLLRSVDGGASWRDVSSNRFRQGVASIDISPHSGEVLVSGCSGTWVLPPPYPTQQGIYHKLHPRPSCFDGLTNGDEQGVDCGGRCAACGAQDGGADAGSADGSPADPGSEDSSAISGGCGCTQHPATPPPWTLLLLLIAVPRCFRASDG